MYITDLFIQMIWHTLCINFITGLVNNHLYIVRLGINKIISCQTKILIELIPEMSLRPISSIYLRGTIDKSRWRLYITLITQNRRFFIIFPYLYMELVLTLLSLLLQTKML